MQVIGLCRFSYPAQGGFQVEHPTMQDRMAYLYAPARLAERFRHFEAITLPSIRAQADGDFTFVILIGDSLPGPWRDRLEALVTDVPQARIVAHPPGPHRQVMQDVMNTARDMDRPCIQFRHDDDDAVAVDFIALLREAARDCAGLIGKNRLVGIDFNNGHVASADAGGLRAEPSQTPYWGVAQAAIVKPGVKQSIMNFAHFKINRFMPTVTFAQPDMFVRGHNDFNDSRQKKSVAPRVLPRLGAEGEALFRARFNIDADHVRRVFSGA